MISEFFYITKTAKAGHFFYQMQKMHTLCLIPMGLCGDLWRFLLQQSAYNFLITLQFGPPQKNIIQKKIVNFMPYGRCGWYIIE